jgi:hypothetical protein
LKETRFAYVAGLIDADGSFSISRSESKQGYVSYDPLVRIRSKHLPTMQWLAGTFGGHHRPSIMDGEIYYEWKFSSDTHASRFLERILPYVWIKKKQSLVLKEYYGLRGVQNKTLRQSLYERIIDLNQNESVTTNTPRLPFSDKILPAYVAGIFDGEGSAYVIRVKQTCGSGFYYRASLSLGMSYKPLITELQRLYGGAWRQRPPHRGNLPMYQWDVQDNKSKQQFALSVLPYLVTKKEQVNITLNFARMNGKPDPEKRIKLWKRCSALNGNMIEPELTGDRESALLVTATA